jgi:plastocyanin
VQFTNVIGNAPQTVTFGPLLNTPALFPSASKAEVNPQIARPQGGTKVVDPSSTIYSSGALLTGVPGARSSYTFSFPTSGVFSYRSLFHPDTLGQILVVPPEVPASPDPPDQSAALFDGLRGLAQVVPDLLSSARSGVVFSGRTAQAQISVKVGDGSNIISIQTFLPAVITCQVGATVTWQIGETDGDPHEIVFNQPSTAESQGGVPLYTGFAPDGGLKVNPAYWKPSLLSGTTVITSTVQHAPNHRWTSGILYQGGVTSPSAVPTQYSLTFNAPGAYTITDPFHVNMTGTVSVLP